MAGCSTSYRGGAGGGSSAAAGGMNAGGWGPRDPEYYMKYPGLRPTTEVEDIYRRWDEVVPAESWPTLEGMVRMLVEAAPATAQELDRAMVRLRRAYKCIPKKAQLLHVYKTLVSENRLPRCPGLGQVLVKKSSKSESGVLVITVLTSPYPKVGDRIQRFSCKWNVRARGGERPRAIAGGGAGTD